MEKLLGWVKQIFVISILSELIIHLLPDEKYEGVVRLVCGCMIAVSCVMPVINILQNKYNIDFDLSAASAEISELKTEIIFSGKDAGDKLIEKYIQKQQEIVTQKVIDAGFTPSSVEITADTDEQSDTYLDIQKIEIALDKKDKKIFYGGQDTEFVISDKVINLKQNIAQYYELNQGLVNIYIL